MFRSVDTVSGTGEVEVLHWFHHLGYSKSCTVSFQTLVDGLTEIDALVDQRTGDRSVARRRRTPLSASKRTELTLCFEAFGEQVATRKDPHAHSLLKTPGFAPMDGSMINTKPSIAGGFTQP